VASDFSCSVAMFGRALVEGLFGVVPNALDGELLIRPGLPREWDSASISTPDVGYTYSRADDTEAFQVRAKFRRRMRLRLEVRPGAVQVAQVTVDGKKADWKCVPRVSTPLREATESTNLASLRTDLP